MIGHCELCGNPVDEWQAAFPISGWEPLRKQGGANHVIDRERDRTRVAHVRCIRERADRRRAGISESQESLL